MNTTSATYLVPVDFTPASVSAIRFAIDLSKNEADEIVLLHVIKSDRERHQTELTMQGFAAEHASDYKGKLTTKIIEGALTQEIEEAVKILGIDLVVLCTHCITGLGKVFRSHAFKIVEDISVPLIIVQKETVFQNIKKIMMTIDLERESVQIVRMAANLAKMFNSEIILVAKEHKDADFKHRQDINLAVCRKVLQEHNIAHRFILVDGNDFIGNIFKLSQEEKIDLLAATYYQQHVHIFTESFVQTLAYNDFHIPLLTMDEESTHRGTQFGAMWG
ncbi:MAG: universal stress protein [Fluviicola sp.]|jgi:nucleotide-binding universal stress UspA family protein